MANTIKQIARELRREAHRFLHAANALDTHKKTARRHRLSKAGKKRIAAGQRKRWKQLELAISGWTKFRKTQVRKANH
jgi:hypothetical protein